MKRIYPRFRLALMTFTLGMAVVYVLDGVSISWNEVPVKLPTAVSSNILVVFPDNSGVLTREKNCGRDPRDVQARIDCAKARLFGNRELSLYAPYEVICDSSQSDNDRSVCGYREARKTRDLLWQHWQKKTQAHIVVKYVGDGWKNETHYFVEPNCGNRWHVLIREKSHWNLLVDGQETVVEIVDDRPLSYGHVRWKTATEDEGPYYVLAGAQYLEFADDDDRINWF